MRSTFFSTLCIFAVLSVSLGDVCLQENSCRSCNKLIGCQWCATSGSCVADSTFCMYAPRLCSDDCDFANISSSMSSSCACWPQYSIYEQDDLRTCRGCDYFGSASPGCGPWNEPKVKEFCSWYPKYQCLQESAFCDWNYSTSACIPNPCASGMESQSKCYAIPGCKFNQMVLTPSRCYRNQTTSPKVLAAQDGSSCIGFMRKLAANFPELSRIEHTPPGTLNHRLVYPHASLKTLEQEFKECWTESAGSSSAALVSLLTDLQGSITLPSVWTVLGTITAFSITFGLLFILAICLRLPSVAWITERRGTSEFLRNFDLKPDFVETAPEPGATMQKSNSSAGGFATFFMAAIVIVYAVYSIADYHSYNQATISVTHTDAAALPQKSPLYFTAWTLMHNTSCDSIASFSVSTSLIHTCSFPTPVPSCLVVWRSGVPKLGIVRELKVRMKPNAPTPVDYAVRIVGSTSIYSPLETWPPLSCRLSDVNPSAARFAPVHTTDLSRYLFLGQSATCSGLNCEAASFTLSERFNSTAVLHAAGVVRRRCDFGLFGLECGDMGLVFNQSFSQRVDSGESAFSLAIDIPATFESMAVSNVGIAELLLGIASFAGAMVGVHAIVRIIFGFLQRTPPVLGILFGAPLFFLPITFLWGSFEVTMRYGLLLGSAVACFAFMVGILFLLYSADKPLLTQDGFNTIGDPSDVFLAVNANVFFAFVCLTVMALSLVMIATAYYRKTTWSTTLVERAKGTAKHLFGGFVLGFLLPVLGGSALLELGSIKPQLIPSLAESGALYGTATSLIVVCASMVGVLWTEADAAQLEVGYANTTADNNINSSVAIFFNLLFLCSMVLMIRAFLELMEGKTVRPRGTPLDAFLGALVGLIPGLGPVILSFRPSGTFAGLVASTFTSTIIQAAGGIVLSYLGIFSLNIYLIPLPAICSFAFQLPLLRMNCAEYQQRPRGHAGHFIGGVIAAVVLPIFGALFCGAYAMSEAGATLGIMLVLSVTSFMPVFVIDEFMLPFPRVIIAVLAASPIVVWSIINIIALVLYQAAKEQSNSEQTVVSLRYRPSDNALNASHPPVPTKDGFMTETEMLEYELREKMSSASLNHHSAITAPTLVEEHPRSTSLYSPSTETTPLPVVGPRIREEASVLNDFIRNE